MGISGDYPGWGNFEVFGVSMSIKLPISTVIAMAFGGIVLVSYFLDFPLLIILRNVFVQWAIILSAVALLVGVVNLIRVHWKKVSKDQQGGIYSLILILAFVIALGVSSYYGPTGTWALWIFNYIQVPIETSLMAILAVVLAYASARLLRRRINLFSLVFFTTGLIVLIGTVPLLGVEIPGVHGPEGLRALITQIPVVAGARGILLGVALGTIATGLRVLIGSDRPYGG